MAPPPAALTTFDVPLRSTNASMAPVATSWVGSPARPKFPAPTPKSSSTSTSLANQVRHGRPAACGRLDRAGHQFRNLPRRHAKLRQQCRLPRLRLPLVCRRSAHARFIRRLRLLQRRPAYTSVGGFISRPPRGSLYLGFNDYQGGPISSDVVTASYTYRMSPKWLSTFGTSFDLRQQGNIGESFRLTRIGESFLFSIGMNVDVSRGNVGVSVSLVPRFLGHDPSITRGQVDVPPAGLYGLE